jgi:uncharacterized protein YggT (Ycf19 family)
MLGNNKRNIPTKRSWEIMCKVWPAITQAQHSEKPSILNLIDQIVNKTVKNVETTSISIQVSHSMFRQNRKNSEGRRLFMKVMHPVYAQLRSLGYVNSGFSEDSLLCGEINQECTEII